MIQPLPKLQRIYQGLAASVVKIQPVDLFSFNQKGDHLAPIEFYLAESAAMAQEKCPPEDIRGLNCTSHQKITPFFKKNSVTNTCSL
jgi:hypothetical protein